MTANPGLFETYTDADVLRLVLAQPLAWFTSGEGATFHATLLPLRPVTNDQGRITTLVGHFPRSHVQAARLRESPRATVLVLGPNGYISPSWMQDRTQAPTWNYASAQFIVDVEFVDEEQALEAHLNDLVNAMEAGRPRAWSVAETASRYTSLSRRIVMFRAHVQGLHAKFKLGQDERDDVYQDIVGGLDRAQDGKLLEWMSGFNPERSAP